MWLLHTDSLVLEHIVDSKDDRFAYAILSHTWEDDEVTFQDMKSGSGKDKKGYQKIMRTCEQASKDCLQYAWVDTCCINKESSAELTEAINSMWQWYSNARICYAYLSDVDGACPELRDSGDCLDGKEECDENPWHAVFCRSRWFTRGWTLQELLAPKATAFYSQGWSYIGSKECLIRTLSTRTGIDPLALECRESLTSFVIARKMSWAAGRQTSRIEDRAYSLLGIFGINMPLLYGEGAEAFTRLQEELVRTSTDQSLLAWNPEDEKESPGRIDMLFASSPDQFRVGKRIVRWETDLADSHYHLSNKGIEFHSLFFAETDRAYLGILNCRFEDDLRGPLALHLFQKDQISSASKQWEVVTRNQFWIGEPDDAGHTKEGPSLRNVRLIVFDGSRAVRQYDRQVTMLRYHPTLHTGLHWNFKALPKVWLRKNESSSEAFDIVAAHPEQAWNKKTGVMCPLARKQVPASVTGSVAIRFRQSEKLLSVAFTYSTRFS